MPVLKCQEYYPLPSPMGTKHTGSVNMSAIAAAHSTTLLLSHTAHPMTPSEGARWALCRRSRLWQRVSILCQEQSLRHTTANRNSAISVCCWVRLPWTSYFLHESRMSDLVLCGLNSF